MSRTFIVQCPKCHGKAKLMFAKMEDIGAIQCDNCHLVEPYPKSISSVKECFPDAVEMKD